MLPVVESHAVTQQVRTGMQAQVQQGEGFSGSRFVEGSALVQATGMQSFPVADFTVYLTSGELYITYLGNQLSIAAITAPVLVQHKQSSIVIPAGRQWQPNAFARTSLQDTKLWFASRETTPLPQRFLQRQLQSIQDFTQLPAEEVFAQTPTGMLHKVQLLLQPLRLPKAREAVAEELRRADAHMLWESVTTANVPLLVAQLAEFAPSITLVSTMLQAMPHESAASITLLEYIAQQEEVWLLYAAHPRWRDATWTIQHANASTEALANRLLALPLSDTAPEAVSTLSLQRWIDATVAFSSSIADPVPFIEKLLFVTGQQVRASYANGYPQRSADWANALQQVVDTVQIRLSEEAIAHVRATTQIDTVDVGMPVELPEPDQEEEVVAVETTPEEQADYSPEAVENRALQVLQQMGAIFTVETTVQAVAPNTAAVRGIVFSSPSGDYVFDFLYNTATGSIDQIIRNTEKFPYALSVSAFTEWVQK